MGRSSRLRDLGGAVRLRRRSGGRTSKERGQGERRRRRIRRGLGLGRQVNREEAKERESSQEKGRKVRESIRRGGARGGLRRRREVKNGDREKRKRRTNGEYRRRLGRGRRGAVVRREVGDRRERYLGLERRALSTYVMVGYRRGSAYATEAGRKYYRVGTRGSCRRLLGRARVYGETGRVKREDRGSYIRTESTKGERTKESVGRRRMMWVMRFKRGALPVHRWVADIYEGAPSMAGRYLRVVPKRSRRRVRVRRRERKGPRGVGNGVSREMVRRSVCGRGSLVVGSRGRLVNRRWKRYMGYSGISNVGNIRLGGRRRTEEGRKGIRRTLRTYMRMVRRRWGGMRRLGVVRRGHKGRPERKGSKERRERKYLTERRGRGKENRRMGMTRTIGRMSRVGRPPRLGFGAKRSVNRARVEEGRRKGESRYRERAGRGRLRGMVGAYGYLRVVKRIRMEEVREGEGGSCTAAPLGKVRRRRKVKKEGARRLGRGSTLVLRGWRNGEGVERRRDRRGREVLKRVE